MRRRRLQFAIKAKKELINNAQSHANVVSADSVFRIADQGDLVSAPFFDIEDDYFVKTDLWLASSIAVELMDLFYGVNKDETSLSSRTTSRNT